MDKTVPNETKESKQARYESGANEASENYSGKANGAEKKFSDKIKNLFSGKNVLKMGALEALEAIPVVPGLYSAADLIVAADGLNDILKSVADKDVTRGVKGVAKLAVAGIPVPMSGASVVLDELLPNEERKKAEEQSSQTADTKPKPESI